MTAQTSTVTATPMPTHLDDRIHYLDQVRALAMLAGIFLHAALTYGEGAQEIWFLTDKASSLGLTIFFGFIHLFRMALFFLVAGFFANLLIRKRGANAFLRNRANRILLPFVIFYPIIIISYGAYFLYAATYLNEDEMSPLLKIIAEGILNQGQASGEPQGQPPLSTTHLWFLYNLIYFCLLTAFLQNFKSEKITRLASILFGSGRHLLYIPLLLVPALYVVQAPMPAPDRFTPQLWSYGYYGFFFLVGWHFFYHQNYLDIVKRHLGKLTAFCVIGFVIFLSVLELPDFSQGATPAMLDPYADLAFDPQRFIAVLMEAYLSVYLVLIFLYLGKVFLSRENHYMRYVSDASYWIYLIHVPFLLFVQITLVRYDWPVLVKFAVSSAFVFVISIIIYDLLIRYSFVGSMLNGKKTRKKHGIRTMLKSTVTEGETVVR